MANEEIEISELEYTEEVAPDNLIPIESVTDTKATSLQVLRDWFKSFFVSKTGDEEIGGHKTFTSEIYSTVNNVINRITSSGDGSVRIFDYNSAVYTRLRSANCNVTPKETYIDVVANQDGLTKIILNADTVYSTASDANGSIVTTVNKSKALDGYFQLGNGLIINWGRIGTGSGSQIITFSKAYSTIPNLFAGNNYNSTGQVPGFADQSTTGCKVYHNSGISGWWLAIGY